MILRVGHFSGHFVSQVPPCSCICPLFLFFKVGMMFCSEDGAHLVYSVSYSTSLVFTRIQLVNGFSYFPDQEGGDTTQGRWTTNSGERS